MLSELAYNKMIKSINGAASAARNTVVEKLSSIRHILAVDQ